MERPVISNPTRDSTVNFKGILERFQIPQMRIHRFVFSRHRYIYTHFFFLSDCHVYWESTLPGQCPERRDTGKWDKACDSGSMHTGSSSGPVGELWATWRLPSTRKQEQSKERLTCRAGVLLALLPLLGAALTQQLIVAHEQLHGRELVETGLHGALFRSRYIALRKGLKSILGAMKPHMFSL